MTQYQHTLLAIVIIQLIWIFFLSKFFYTEKDIAEWQDIISRFFNLQSF